MKTKLAGVLIYMVLLPSGHAQTVLPPAVDAFVSSAAALAKSGDDTAQLGRTNYRNNLIRKLLTEKIRSGAKQFALSDLDEVKLLCDPRKELLVFSAQKNYIQSVSAKIDEVGKPSKIENLSEAIGVLFAHQSIDVKDIPDQASFDKQKQAILALCTQDLAKFEPYYYGTTVTPPAGEEAEGALSFSAFGPVGSLIDTIISIITPVVVEGAKIVDEQQRRNAVLNFLTPANIKKIQDAGQSLSDRVSEAVLAKRRVLAGTFEDAIASVRHKSIDLEKIDSCKGYLALAQKGNHRPSGVPNDEFVACWSAAWAALAPNVAIALKSASDYDDLADAGDTTNAKKSFQLMSKSLDAIANREQSLSASELNRLWTWTVELVAFAEKIAEAASPENRKKISDAIDKVVKAY